MRRSARNFRRTVARSDGRVLPLFDPELIMHLLNSGDVFGNLFGQPFCSALVYRAGERHFTTLHFHVDVGRIHAGVTRELLIDVLTDTVIGALPVLRTAAGEAPAVA